MSCKSCDQCACGWCAPEYPYTDLEAFRKTLCSLSIWSFNGWESSQLRQTKHTKPCDLWVGENLNDPTRVGREDIRKALVAAEMEFFHELGYAVVPTWVNDEVLGYNWPASMRATPWNNASLRINWGNPGPRVIQTEYAPIVTVGREKHSILGTVTRRADEWAGDGFILRRTALNIPDKFIITVPVPQGAKPDEIQLYFAPGDRYEHEDDNRRWRIPTESVKITNTNGGSMATITGHPAVLAKPELQASTVPLPRPYSEAGDDYTLNPAYLPNYVSEVEVRFVYTVSLDGLHAHVPCGCGACRCGGPTCGHCQNMRFCIENLEYGLVRPVWPWGHCQNMPDKFCLNYLTYDCSRDWTKEIAALATARLGCPVCSCGNDGMAYWRQDVATDKERVKTYEQLNAAFMGTRQGEIFAAKAIDRYRKQRIAIF